MGDWNNGAHGEQKPLPRRRPLAGDNTNVSLYPPLSAERSKRRPVRRPGSGLLDNRPASQNDNTDLRGSSISSINHSPRLSTVVHGNSPRNGPSTSPILLPRNCINAQSSSMDKPRSDLSLLKSRIRRHAKATQNNVVMQPEASRHGLAASESSKSIYPSSTEPKFM